MMLLHPDPHRVLAVGCAADGSVEAMVRHPVTELLLVEEDPALIRRLRRWYGESYRTLLDGPTIRTLAHDPVRVLETQDMLDLVILADGNPSSLRANRTRTLEFFQGCRRAMAPDAILVLEVDFADTYLGGVAGRLLAVLSETLRQVFPVVVAIPGEHILLVAGGEEADLTTTTTDLENRAAERPGLVNHFHPAQLPMLVDPTRQPALEQFLSSAEARANTINHPRAVLPAASLHEARSRSSLVRLGAGLEGRDPEPMLWVLAVAATALLATAISRRHSARATAAAAAVGFASMGWWLLLLATWQARLGSVYAEIGALTGLFMAGVAAGGWLGLQSANPVRILPWILGVGTGLSLLLAGGVPTWAPALMVPTFLVAGGVLTGAAFPGLGRLAGRGSNRRGAGIAFAADELGAACAALVIGTVAIPWVGMTATAVGLAILGLAAIPVVFRA